MIPDDIDKNILEYVANDEPWHIVCGVFYHKFQNPQELIDLIFKLYQSNLISITKGPNTSTEPSSEVFLKEAKNNNWFEDDDCTDGDWWDIQATEKGFEYVKDRFKPRIL